MQTEDAKNCTDANECVNSPCMNGGTCKNLDRGEGFYCMCPDGFSGDLCNALKQEKVMRLSTAALAAILICLINILSEYYYLGVCFRLLAHCTALQSRLYRRYCLFLVFSFCRGVLCHGFLPVLWLFTFFLRGSPLTMNVALTKRDSNPCWLHTKANAADSGDDEEKREPCV